MPEFTRELSTPSVQPFIQQGVRDTSTAQAIESLGGFARDIAAGAAVAKFTGGAKSIDEVEGQELPQVTGTEEEQIAQRVSQIEELNTLSQIAAARKGGLRGDIAKARAGVALRKALKDNAMFAPEIRKAFSGFFRSAADTQFFVDPKREKTFQEEIQEQAQREIYEIHVRRGISLEDAENKWRTIQTNQARLEELNVKKSLKEDDIASITSLTFNQMAFSSTAEVMDLIESSPGGKLSPEDIASFRFKAKTAVDHARTAWFKKVVDTTGVKPTQAQLDAFDAEAEQYVENRQAILQDVDLRKYVADNKELVSNLIDIDAKLTFTTLAKIKAAGGEGAVSMFLEAMQNKNYKAYLQKHHPAMWEMIQAAQRPVEGLNQVANGALKFLLSPSGSPEEKASKGSAGAVAPLVKEPSSAAFLKTQGKLKTIFNEAPAALVLMDSPKWRNAIDQGFVTERGRGGTILSKKPVSIDMVETGIKTAIKRRMNDYFLENEKQLDDISIKERENIRRGGRSIEIVDGDGNLVSQEFYSTILDAAKVAKRFPELWEDKFETAEDYIKSVIVPEAAPKEGLTEEEKETVAPQKIDSQALRKRLDEGDREGVVQMLTEQGFTSEDSEKLFGLNVSLLEEAEQKELRLKQAMKEYGLTREEAEEALDGVKR